MSPAGSAQGGVRGMIAAAVLRARSRWQPSPVVLLVGLGSRDLLTDADAWLSASGRAGGRRARGVPHALVTVGPGHDDARALLDQAALGLDDPVGGPPLQLRRYDLVRLLLHQPPPATASRHVMRRWLRQQLGAMYSWVGPHPGHGAEQPVVGDPRTLGGTTVHAVAALDPRGALAAAPAVPGRRQE